MPLLWYGYEGIAVERGIDGANWQERLKLMNGVEDVSVSGSGTETTRAVFSSIGSSNATIEGSTDLYVLELVAARRHTVSGPGVHPHRGELAVEASMPSQPPAANPDTEEAVEAQSPTARDRRRLRWTVRGRPWRLRWKRWTSITNAAVVLERRDDSVGNRDCSMRVTDNGAYQASNTLSPRSGAGPAFATHR